MKQIQVGKGNDTWFELSKGSRNEGFEKSGYQFKCYQAHEKGIKCQNAAWSMLGFGWEFYNKLFQTERRTNKLK